MNRKIASFVFAFVLSLSVFYSCSKSDGPDNTDPCAGKTINVTATVTPTSAPTATNGVITATASGSSGFTYNLNGGAYQSSGTFSNLAPGSYTVGAKDAAGCVKTASFTVTATSCPSITITATITPTTGSAATNGAINATAAGSTGFTYSLNSGAFQTSGNFTGLATGTYTVTAKDGNGCTGSNTFVVNAASCPTITVTATSTAASGPTATNGSLTASASGGAAPYNYSINGGASQSGTVFSNLSPGNYTVVATDANGCSGTSATIVVGVNCPSLTVSGTAAGSDKCRNNTGSITITASGSSGYTYNLNGGSYQASSTFNGLATGNFTIGVRDQNGCTASSTVNVPIAAAGTRFTQVKNLMVTYCATSGCHAGATPQSGINLSDDCTIVNQAARIRARAVDGTGGFMPPSSPLSASQRQQIVDWINAGGQHSNN